MAPQDMNDADLEHMIRNASTHRDYQGYVAEYNRRNRLKDEKTEAERHSQILDVDKKTLWWASMSSFRLR